MFKFGSAADKWVLGSAGGEVFADPGWVMCQARRPPSAVPVSPPQDCG